MTNTVFFSWQADREKTGGRNLIERALERATSQIDADTGVEEAVRNLEVDRNTKGVAGSPPIVDTIFRKIDQAAVFVPNLTFVGARADNRPTPNPNVLVEYGWALKSLSYNRIVPVMNTAYGEPTGDAMPFDMRHLRNPITYKCEKDASSEERKQVRERLAKELEAAIRAVLSSEEFQASLPKPPEPAKFVEKQPVDGRGRFKAIDEPVGVAADRGLRTSIHELFISARPVTWFRMMPLTDPGRAWSVDELARDMQTPFVQPISLGWRGFDFVRSHEGYGIYTIFPEQRDQIRAIVFAFTTGEVWSVDTHWLDAYKNDKDQPTIPSDEKSFRAALMSYGKFLEKLGVNPPFKWIAGMENLKGRFLYVPPPPGQMGFFPGPHGKCTQDVISQSGVYSPGDPLGPALKPFFEKLYNACGVRRADWQDQ